MTWDDIHDLMVRLAKSHLEDGEYMLSEVNRGNEKPSFLEFKQRWNETDETLRQNGVIK